MLFIVTWKGLEKVPRVAHVALCAQTPYHFGNSLDTHLRFWQKLGNKNGDMSIDRFCERTYFFSDASCAEDVVDSARPLPEVSSSNPGDVWRGLKSMTRKRVTYPQQIVGLVFCSFHSPANASNCQQQTKCEHKYPQGQLYTETTVTCPPPSMPASITLYDPHPDPSNTLWVPFGCPLFPSGGLETSSRFI